jgi:outer membrane protein with beta-barrel domain
MSFSFCRRLLLAAIVTSLPALAQLSVGIKAGVPLNDVYVDAGQGIVPRFGTTNRFLIGPEVDLNLPFHLGVEADALYRHYNLGGSGVNEWDFPILLKYRFSGVPVLHPFVDAGPIFNHVSEIPQATRNGSVPGVVFGAGIDLHLLFLHVKPEFRYIHWTDVNHDFALLDSSLASNQNQAQILLGVTF